MIETEKKPLLNGPLDLPVVREIQEQSDDRYKLLVSSVRDYAIYLLDINGIVQTWNAGAENLKGYVAHEIIGQSFKKFYTPEDLARNHPDAELEIAKREGRYEEEGWRVRKDGTRFWANVLITRLVDETGQVTGFAKVTRDLTERKIAEEAIRESEERFRLIIESVKDYAIIMLSPDGVIVSWNEGARRLNGYEAGQIIGKHFSVFYEQEEIDLGKCEYELKEAAITGRFEDEGWRIRSDGSKFWANVVITALRDRNGDLRGFAKVTRDMTDRKRAADRLQMAHQGLEKRVAERTKELQQAIESRDLFLSIASHELKTPLTTLKLQQQLLERQLARNPDQPLAPEKAREIAEMTGRQVAQLTRLVDDMLDVARISTGRLPLDLREVDLSSLLARAVQSLSAQAQSLGVRVNLSTPPQLPAFCDARRIEQVISNLVLNSFKYGGGTTVNITAVSQAGFIYLHVSDSGPGIAIADQERIFERFERAISANESSGLGLGLYISKQIVEAHGGQIGVVSSPGKGADFRIRLPAPQT